MTRRAAAQGLTCSSSRASHLHFISSHQGQRTQVASCAGAPAVDSTGSGEGGTPWTTSPSLFLRHRRRQDRPPRLRPEPGRPAPARQDTDQRRDRTMRGLHPLQTRGRVLVVIDQPAFIGALAIAVARSMGVDIGYLPGLTIRRLADLRPGQAKTDARDASIIADAAPVQPRALRRVGTDNGDPGRPDRLPRPQTAVHPTGQPASNRIAARPHGPGTAAGQPHRRPAGPADLRVARRRPIPSTARVETGNERVQRHRSATSARS